jgi:hypothetical protein
MFEVSPTALPTVRSLFAVADANNDPLIASVLHSSPVVSSMIVWPLAIVTVSAEVGSTPLGHGAFGVVLLQLPEPVVEIAAIG